MLTLFNGKAVEIWEMHLQSLAYNVFFHLQVQDIKRMQNNWMKQRSAAAEEITPVVETKQKTKRGNVTSNTRVNTDKGN